MHGVQVSCPSPNVTWEQFVWRLRRGFVQCRAGEGTALINRVTVSKDVEYSWLTFFFFGAPYFNVSIHQVFWCTTPFYMQDMLCIQHYSACLCAHGCSQQGPHQVVWLPGKARVAASARGLIDFLMISGQAPSPCQYQGFGLATAASLWPLPRTTIDSPPAPSLFGLLAMCQNPLAQSSVTIERDHFRFIFLALLSLLRSRLLSLPLSFVLSLSVSSSSSALAKMKRETQRKRSNL